MERTPPFLAAVASAAVPGLDPVTVEALPSLPSDQFDVAFVRDTEHRRWVVRAPRTETAGAALDASVPLLALLARRVGFGVPAPKGFLALKGGGRAAVYPLVPGDPIDFGELAAVPGLPAEIGRTLAAVHNLDQALIDEAGLPTYDADTYRTRRLSDLDRAAATGRVPTALLDRWEQALEDVSLWRFAATAVHGRFDGDQVLVVVEDEGTPEETVRVRGVVGWEQAKVADPADDFAALVDQVPGDVLDRVMEAYAHARLERPDANLLVRAQLASELEVLRHLMEALGRHDDAAVEGLTARLRRLDERVHSLTESSDDYQRMSLTAAGMPSPPAPPPLALEDDQDDDVVAPVTGESASADGLPVDPAPDAALDSDPAPDADPDPGATRSGGPDEGTGPDEGAGPVRSGGASASTTRRDPSQDTVEITLPE